MKAKIQGKRQEAANKEHHMRGTWVCFLSPVAEQSISLILAFLLANIDNLPLAMKDQARQQKRDL